MTFFIPQQLPCFLEPQSGELSVVARLWPLNTFFCSHLTREPLSLPSSSISPHRLLTVPQSCTPILIKYPVDYVHSAGAFRQAFSRLSS